MGLIDALRSGAWLTRARVRRWSAAMLIAAAGGIACLLATAHGLTDFHNRPLGTDFAGFYVAGTYAAHGDPTAPYDPARERAGEQAMFGSDTPFYSFSYPPFLLLLASALAQLPYALALALWQGASLVLYLLAMRAVLRTGPATDAEGPARDRLWVLLALAFPAVFVNLCHGQNGLLTAALLAGALAFIERRPILAGVLFGLLAYKPQFGLIIPLALGAGGYWRTIAAAAACVVLAALATLAAYGPESWLAFMAATDFMRVVLLESGAGGWHRMPSVFAWARMWGGSVALAYAFQGGVTLALAVGVIWLWRRPVPFALKAAGLSLAVPLSTPYSFDYDLMALAPAVAFFALYGTAYGFSPFAKTALAALWMVPLLARPVAGATFVPLAVPTMLAAFILALRDAATARARVPAPVDIPRRRFIARHVLSSARSGARNGS